MNFLIKILIVTATLVVSLPIMIHAKELAPITADSKLSYSQQSTWQELQNYLPPEYRLQVWQLPKEYIWDWNGHQVHIEKYLNPNAKAKVILLHGVGTNGRQMTLILGHPLAQLGYETIAIDNLGYGMTQVNSAFTYDDWVQLVSDYITYEQQQDNRPIFLYGLSAGGMLAYHASTINPNVAGIIGMTFLDQTNLKVAKATMNFPALSVINLPALKILAKTPLKSIKLPMQLVSKMYTLVNNKEVLKLLLKDRTSAGNSMSIAFLNSYMNFPTTISTEQANNSHIILTQPEKDRWSPLALSLLFLNKFKQQNIKITILPNTGHYPIEKEGLDKLQFEAQQFIESIIKP